MKKLNKKGLTLIELLVVIVILVIISLLVIPSVINMLGKNKNEKYKNYENLLVENMKLYRIDNSENLGDNIDTHLSLNILKSANPDIKLDNCVVHDLYIKNSDYNVCLRCGYDEETKKYEYESKYCETANVPYGNPPTTTTLVKSVKTTPASGYLNDGNDIKIEVILSRQVTGSYPTLTILAGNNNKTLTGVLEGNKLVYNYTVKNGDNGKFNVVSLNGGSLKDIENNEEVNLELPVISSSITLDTIEPTCNITLTNKRVEQGITKVDLKVVGSDTNLGSNSYSFDNKNYNDVTVKTIIADGNYKAYVKDLANNVGMCSKLVYIKNDNLDTSGANNPVLASNMIPVYYDEQNDVWRKADKNNKKTTVTYKLGDINGDGNITADDLTEIARYLEGLSSNIKLKEKSADLDGDGKVTENDKNLLAKYVAKISSADFPAGVPLEEKTATIINRWYSYESSGENKGMWANAVTVTSDKLETYKKTEIDTPISMDDITTMWVWIPRFNASLPSNYNGGTKDNPGAINVFFVDSGNKALDAFTFGNKELSGFWYGKFEIGTTTIAGGIINGLACTNETCENANKLLIKPNIRAQKPNNVSNYFFAARSMEQPNNSFGFVSSEVDTHMSKNNEWGAVAYLTQSIHGRCKNSKTCTEIGINNAMITDYKLGYGAPAGSASSSSTTNAYNTSAGMDASTTGTIYGIYDMSGGTSEYVMGVYADSNGNPMAGRDSTYYSGFNGTLENGTMYTSGVPFPDSKYYNLYTSDSYFGHSITETKNWYGDSYTFVSSNNPWIVRGGRNIDRTKAGIFNFVANPSINNNDAYSSRFVVTNE